jgi:HEAT repeats
MSGIRTAHADDVSALADTLTSSSSEKERISAVTSLARLADKRALRPLVGALHDPSAMVRAIAAAGLGKLGHRAALPALREAQNDPDPLVQKRARTAMVQVCEANNIAVEAPAAPEPPSDPDRGRAGFGHGGHPVAARPDVYVVIKSTSDDSPGRADDKARKLNAGILRAAMMGSLHGESRVTSVAEDAAKYGLDAQQVDLSITKLEQRASGDYVEIEAQLRLAISDDHGRMKSFLSNGAKVQVPKRTFDARYLPQLRREALENAARGLVDDLLTHVRRTAGT